MDDLVVSLARIRESSILDRSVPFILASVAESARKRVSKIQRWLTTCMSAELASRWKIVGENRGEVWEDPY